VARSGVRQNDPRRERAYSLARDGLSLQQIAEAMDIPYGTIARWSSVDGWQKQIADEQLKDRVKLARKMTDLMARETYNSLQTLVEIRDDPKAPHKERRAAANDFINHSLGLNKLIDGFERMNAIEAETPLSIDRPSPAPEELSDDELEERQRLRVVGQ